MAVADGGGSARDASALAAMRLVASLGNQQAGLRAVHAAGVLSMLLERRCTWRLPFRRSAALSRATNRGAGLPGAVAAARCDVEAC